MTLRISIPIITPEIDFVARHAATVEEVLENQPNSPIGAVTATVWSRAVVDADKFFRNLEQVISDATTGTIRIEWANTNRGEKWESWGRLFMPRGPMRRIGSAGFGLGENDAALRLIGWLWPRWGGRDGRRELVRRCGMKIKGVLLPHEYPNRYPGFTEDHGIVWLDEQLSLKTDSDRIVNTVRKRARTFLKAAKPVLKELAST